MRAARLLRHHKIRATNDRVALLRAAAARPRYFTIQDLANECAGTHRATAYRLVPRLVQCGVLKAVCKGESRNHGLPPTLYQFDNQCWDALVTD